MNLQVLKYYIVISESKSFTKAAERLFITQPTLSRQIQELEEELGVLLLHREGHRLALTPAGKRFLKEAKEIVRRCDSLRDLVKREEVPQNEGNLRICIQEHMDMGFLHPVIRSFAGNNPYVDLSVMRSSYLKLQQSLLSGKCDLAFTLKIYVQDLPDLVYFPVKKNQLQIAVPDSHPLACRKAVDIEELVNEKFMILERKISPLTVDYVIGLCAKAGFSPKTAQYVGDVESALLLTDAGKGITFLFSSVNVKLDHIRILNVSGEHEALDIVVASQNHKDNPAVDLFLQEITNHSGKEFMSR